MPVQYVLSDVSGEVIMDVAKVIATSPRPLSRTDISRSLEAKYKDGYVSLAINASHQLGVVDKQAGYTIHANYRDVVKRADKGDLYAVFRSVLQEYPPFLLYAEFLSKGYPQREAASMTRGILSIETPLEKVEKVIRNWGNYAQVFDKETGRLVAPFNLDALPFEFVKGLLDALQSELKAKMFLIEVLSPQGFAYLAEKGISLSEMTSALLSYQVDPSGCTEKASNTFESFLYKLGDELGVNVQTCNGIIQLTDQIRTTNKILPNQINVCYGVGGIRNMSSHGPDKKTGIPWAITPHGALLSTLLASATIRSIYLYAKESKQEF